MKVQRVQTPENINQSYPCTTESPIPFWADGLPLCRNWFATNLGKHIEGFHLVDENGNVIGHIYWAPSSHVLAPYNVEDGVAYIYCDWVQRQHRGKGGMHLLFQSLVEFLHSQGYKGILVDGTEFEGYMHYQHFLKRGFQVIRESKGSRLLYYPLRQPSIVVKPIKTRITGKVRAEVEVLVVGSYLCPVGASAVLAIRKVAQELGERVVVKEVPASREVIAKYGVADGIFINGKTKFFGPVEESQVRQAIEEELD
ncbi:MAG: GNAT family N-acetyltransferase [Chloroflexota bacterium]